jgi:hypothetical protein
VRLIVTRIQTWEADVEPVGVTELRDTVESMMDENPDTEDLEVEWLA